MENLKVLQILLWESNEIHASLHTKIVTPNATNNPKKIQDQKTY